MTDIGVPMLTEQGPYCYIGVSMDPMSMPLRQASSQITPYVGTPYVAN